MLKLKKDYISDDIIEKYLIPVENQNLLISSQKTFQNNNPLHVEMGCGNGHFLRTSSLNNPTNNYIGIDLQKKRIMKTISKLNRNNIQNIFVIQGEISHLLKNHFVDQSIDTAYLNFPDPWPKRRHHKNRLVKKDFLDILHIKLKNNAIFYAVSDDKQYFFEILNYFQSDHRYQNALTVEYLNDLDDYEISLYEEKWRKEGRTIYYLKFYKIAI